MTRKMKRTLSLILALVMLCSTMGVMAFAQTRADDDFIEDTCPVCGADTQLYYYCYENTMERIVECPTHGGHDAEEWHIGAQYICRACGRIVPGPDFEITYVCLW